jgi:hypothetical protein
MARPRAATTPESRTGIPDTGSPDTGSPDTGSPDTGSPDTGSPDTLVADRLGTAALRQHALEAWVASPDRFREDANAEEDAGQAHRGRLLDELLQNAADAAGDEPGRVLIRLTPGALEVANSGVPLTPAGVAALSSLRASAKRDTTGTTGRFGVGFAAVLAVSDEPSIRSRSGGGVAWSRAGTVSAVRAAAADSPALAAELARRGDAVPVLRLPVPEPRSTPGVPDSFETLVRLPFRDAAAAAVATAAVDALDPTLLLVLPALGEIRIERPDGPPRTLTCTWSGPDANLDRHRWTGVRRDIDLPADLLAERPVEERTRTRAAVRAFRPSDAANWPATSTHVIRAPQPTDDPLSVPAVLIAPFPVDAGRRRVLDGPLTEFLLDQCGEVLTELAVRTSDLALVPTGLPEGPIDAALAGRLRSLLPDAPMLPDGRRGRQAARLDLDPRSVGALPGLLDVLREVVPDLVPFELAGGDSAAALRTLGVRPMTVADVVELLAGLRRPAAWWNRLFRAMVGLLAAPEAREALAALPVPLADGRTVTGPRGVLLPTADIATAALAGLPLRLADPAALDESARELLRALGARDATPRELLADPLLLDPEVPVDAVLALVQAAGLEPGELPALAGLLLPTTDGDDEPAGDLLLPGGPLDRLVIDDAPFGRVDAEFAARWPPEVLEAVGALRTFAVLRAADLLLTRDEPLLLDLDDSDRWLEETSPPEFADEFVAVRDLELVRWPDALAELVRPPLREIVLASDYTRWWLSSHPVLAGQVPRELAVPTSELVGLFDATPPVPDVDDVFLAALGVRDSLADAVRDPQDAFDLLDRLGDPARPMPWAPARRVLLAVTSVLRRLPDEGLAEPPALVRTPDGVVPRGRCVVLDRPDLLPLLGDRAAVRVPPDVAADVARILELPLAGELGPYAVLGTDPLTVRDLAGRPVQVGWFGNRVDPSAGPGEQARSLAWTRGEWGERYRIEARLRASDASSLDAEDDLDSGPEPGAGALRPTVER